MSRSSTGNSLYVGMKVLKTSSLWTISAAIGLHWSFTDKDELNYMLDGHYCYVRGHIFHLERWMENFRKSNPVTFSKVWFKIPQIPMQFREVEIKKNII